MAPSPVESKVGVILRLPGNGVAAAKQKPQARVAEFVITADIQQNSGFGLGCRLAFRAVVKEFAAQREFFA